MKFIPLFIFFAANFCLSQPLWASGKTGHLNQCRELHFRDSTFEYKLGAGIEYDSVVYYIYSSADDSVRSEKRTFTYDNSSQIAEKLTYKWDANIKIWIIKTKDIWEYDQWANLVLAKRYGYDNGSWIGYSKDENAYDEYGNEIMFTLYDSWNDTLDFFVPSFKKETTWLNGVVTSWTTYNWIEDYSDDVNHGRWLPKDRTESTLNVNGDISAKIMFNWSVNQNSWINNSKSDYTFDEHGRTVSNQISLYQNDQWVNSSKIITTYTDSLYVTLMYSFNTLLNDWEINYKLTGILDSQNNILSVESYNYFAPDDLWQLSTKYEYTYDNGGNKTSEIAANWNAISSEFEYIYKNVYGYDANKNMILSSNFLWDTIKGDWSEDRRTEVIKDIYGNTITIFLLFSDSTGYKHIDYVDDNGNAILYEHYQGFPDNWTLYKRGYYFVKEEIPTNVQIVEQAGLDIFPNPAFDFIRINGNIENGRIKIYDLQGNLKIEKSIGEEREVSISGLPNGTYILIIYSPEGMCKFHLVKY
jgi:hypothetical protein